MSRPPHSTCSSQRLVIDIVRDLHETLDTTVVFVTHDLAVVAELAERVAVMYAGRLVESGTVDEIFFDRAPAPLREGAHLGHAERDRRSLEPALDSGPGAGSERPPAGLPLRAPVCASSADLLPGRAGAAGEGLGSRGFRVMS